MSEGRNIFVAGQTGSGKSWLVKRDVIDVPRLVVYQPKLEDAGYAGVYFNARLGERQAFLEFWQRCNRKPGRWRLVYRPFDKFDADEFDGICRLVHAVGDCVLVAEEIGDYLRPGMFQMTGHYQGIKDLLCSGRTRGATTYWLTQRPHGIPREVTSESREAFLFCLQEPVDLKYVEERFGQQTAELHAKLQGYEHVHWRRGEPPELGKG